MITVALDFGTLARDAITAAHAEAAAEGALDADHVLFEYVTMHDDRVRPSHAALDGTVWRLDDPLAPVPPIDYGCFLPGTMIEGVFDGASRARYAGEAIEVICESGRRLRVTPNHPIPTSAGVVPANLIQEGGQLLCYDPESVSVAFQGVQEHQAPTAVEEVFAALMKRGPVARTRKRSHDFDGDAVRFESDIDIVGSYAVLALTSHADRVQHFEHGGFRLRGGPIPFPAKRLPFKTGVRWAKASKLDRSRDVRGLYLSTTLSWVHSRPFRRFRSRLAAELDTFGQEASRYDGATHAQPFGYRIDGLPIAVRTSDGRHVDWRKMQCARFGVGAQPDTCLAQPGPDGLALNPEFFSDVLRADAALVQTDRVLKVQSFQYHGHVYDLRSPKGYVIANRILASNCRCSMRYVGKPKTLAADVLPEAKAEPLPMGQVFARALDRTPRLANWRDLAKAATAKPLDLRFAFLQAHLRALGFLAADAKDYARMILEALAAHAADSE